jgi:hypothetical protein
MNRDSMRWRTGRPSPISSYVTASLRVRRNEQPMQITVWGRYVDRWSRRNGRWGLDHRLAIRDFDETRQVTQLHHHDIGRRDRSDPSYGVLETNL